MENDTKNDKNIAGKHMKLKEILCKSVKKQKQDYTLQADGERFLPWMKDPVANYEHLHRYRFAKEFVKGKTVLDLACGEGYGSYMLAEDATEVIGIDINEPTIKHASAKYMKDNLKFMESSITNVTIKEGKLFDIIICLEALEHVEDQSKVMAEVKRLLKDNGIFIVSTPNKFLYSGLPSYKNRWHKKELYFDEFKILLESTFNYIAIYGQKVFPASNIFPMFQDANKTQELAIGKAATEFSFVPLSKKEAKYFIAIASDGPTKAIIGSSYLVDTSSVLENVLNELEAIHNSHGWRFLTCYYKFRDKIFPPNTKRRTYAKSLWKMANKTIRVLSKG